MSWTDTHCHLDAAEFDADREAVVQRSRSAGVTMLVLPAVEVAAFDTVARLAHDHGLAYALGIHPLYVDRAEEADLERLDAALHARRDDPRLVAVGEIGLDHFVPPDGAEPALAPSNDRQQQLSHGERQQYHRERQQHFYLAQLRLARAHGLPVILHVRRSADALLAGLRRIEVAGGIAHAFNGSAQQAAQFAARGFKLGFGGALTFERALQIRALASSVADEVPVLETDAPDIPPQWLYVKAEDRATRPPARNEPAELPRIAAALAALRGWSIERTAAQTRANAAAALPRLAALAS